MVTINLNDLITSQLPGGTWVQGDCNGPNPGISPINMASQPNVTFTPGADPPGSYQFAYTVIQGACEGCAEVWVNWTGDYALGGSGSIVLPCEDTEVDFQDLAFNTFLGYSQGNLSNYPQTVPADGTTYWNILGEITSSTCAGVSTQGPLSIDNFSAVDISACQELGGIIVFHITAEMEFTAPPGIEICGPSFSNSEIVVQITPNPTLSGNSGLGVYFSSNEVGDLSATYNLPPGLVDLNQHFTINNPSGCCQTLDFTVGSYVVGDRGQFIYQNVGSTLEYWLLESAIIWGTATGIGTQSGFQTSHLSQTPISINPPASLPHTNAIEIYAECVEDPSINYTLQLNQNEWVNVSTIPLCLTGFSYSEVSTTDNVLTISDDGGNVISITPNTDPTLGTVAAPGQSWTVVLSAACGYYPNSAPVEIELNGTFI